jgi:3-keto-disaccharide hydrolase
MRCLSLVIALVTSAAFAGEKAMPNTLTPKEIADGWILLFDGDTTFGWKVEGDAKVKDGMLVLGGEKAGSVATAMRFGPLRCEFDCSSDGTNWEHEWLGVGKDTAATKLESTPLGLKAEATGETSQLTFSVTAGKLAFLRSIRLHPMQMTPLFDGKDLTDWKEFKPTKDKKVASKFTVTKEGWLNVKNGPGDLQTEGQWADFVVQFECISNGKHLNSGLFFRCIPDLYQQGYEAQIRNQWEGDDRTRPVDFGTGAIYRRQAARKVVSTDGEWFTMTVAAHGRHIATWVNGYQVTDWTDDRKENDNARNGFKKGKGALSIQGHDPTTDLSFRNIRIQSLDPK